MASCKYCGKWAGVASDEHIDCAALAAQGKAPEEISRITDGKVLREPGPLTPMRVFWAVFWALWAFTASAVVVVGVFNLFNELTRP